MAGAVRGIQQTKGERRSFLVSLCQGSFPISHSCHRSWQTPLVFEGSQSGMEAQVQEPHHPCPAGYRGSMQGSSHPLCLTQASSPWIKPLYPMLGGWIPPLLVLSAARESFPCRMLWYQEPWVGCDAPPWRWWWWSECFETLQ